MPPPYDDNPIIDALARIEHWLDARGKAAWIVLIVLSFIFFWPLGLGLLVWVKWGRSLYAPRRAGMSAAAVPAGPPPREASFDDFAQRRRDGAEGDDFDAFLDARGAHLARDRQPDAQQQEHGRDL